MAYPLFFDNSSPVIRAVCGDDGAQLEYSPLHTRSEGPANPMYNNVDTERVRRTINLRKREQESNNNIAQGPQVGAGMTPAGSLDHMLDDDHAVDPSLEDQPLAGSSTNSSNTSNNAGGIVGRLPSAESVENALSQAQDSPTKSNGGAAPLFVSPPGNPPLVQGATANNNANLSMDQSDVAASVAQDHDGDQSLDLQLSQPDSPTSSSANLPNTAAEIEASIDGGSSMANASSNSIVEATGSKSTVGNGDDNLERSLVSQEGGDDSVDDSADGNRNGNLVVAEKEVSGGNETFGEKEKEKETSGIVSTERAQLNSTQDLPTTPKASPTATSSTNSIQETTSSSQERPGIGASKDVDSSQSAETSSKSKAEATVGDGDDPFKEGLGFSQDGLQEGEDDSLGRDEDRNVDGERVLAEKDTSAGKEAFNDEKKVDEIAAANHALPNSTQDESTATKASSTATSSTNPIQETTPSSSPSTSGSSLSTADGTQGRPGIGASKDVDSSQSAETSSKSKAEATVADGDDPLKEGHESSQERRQEGEDDSADKVSYGKPSVAEQNASAGSGVSDEKGKRKEISGQEEMGGFGTTTRALLNSNQDESAAANTSSNPNSSINPIQGTTSSSSSAPSTSGPFLSTAGESQERIGTIDSIDVDSSQLAETSSKSNAEAMLGDGDGHLERGHGFSQEGLQEGGNDSVDGDEDRNGNGNGEHFITDKDASAGKEAFHDEDKVDEIAAATPTLPKSTQDESTAPKASPTSTSSAKPIQEPTSSLAPSTSGPALFIASKSQGGREIGASIEGSQFSQASSKPTVKPIAEATGTRALAGDGSNGAVGTVLNSGNGIIDRSSRSASSDHNVPNTENKAIVGDPTDVKKRISGQNGNETIQRDEMVGNLEETGKGKGKENAAEKNVEKEGVLKVSSLIHTLSGSTDVDVVFDVNKSRRRVAFKNGDKDFHRHSKRILVCHTVVLTSVLQSFDTSKIHTIQYHTNDSITANTFKELNNASSNLQGYMDDSLDPNSNVVLVSNLGWIKDVLQQLNMAIEALPEMRADRSNLSRLAGSSLDDGAVVCWGYYDLSEWIKPEIVSPGGTNLQLPFTFRFQASDRPKASSSGNRPAGVAKRLFNVQPMIGSDNKAIIPQRPMKLQGEDFFSSTASSIASSSKTSQSHANGQASASSIATSSRTSCSTPDGSTKGTKSRFTSSLESLGLKSRVKVPNQEADFDSSPSNILDSHGKNGQGGGSGSSILDSPIKNKLKIGLQSVSKVFSSSPLKPRSDAKFSSPAVSSPLKAAGTFGQGSNSDAGLSGTPTKVRNATPLGTPRTQSAQSPSIKGSPIKTFKTAAKSIAQAVLGGQASLAGRPERHL